MSETRFLFGFPCVGKTYATHHEEELGSKIVDSDSNFYHWLRNCDGSLVYDENGVKIPHPEWPMNYVNIIKMLAYEIEPETERPDWILLSTHDEVMKSLLTTLPEDAICFAMYPAKDMKDEFMQLYKDRGSPQSFIDLMDEKWDEFIDSVTKYETDDRVMMVEIRKESKNIRSVYDLIAANPGRPIEEV